jgi:hypothetical protein
VLERVLEREEFERDRRLRPPAPAPLSPATRSCRRPQRQAGYAVRHSRTLVDLGDIQPHLGGCLSSAVRKARKLRRTVGRDASTDARAVAIGRSEGYVLPIQLAEA